ncbi:hypothetical protein DFR57_11850 [Saliterribacillus persicus]|uniref:Uncharacterized protein n=1 Tax=Saliterribacillus persicus TaxID=930114 RepID=A0A368X615_9BACI|nr:hypothetical protein DFR57_11850 [Saliterribacillus persicus]
MVKRKIITFIIVILILLEVWYLLPKPITETYQGGSYQLGGNTNFEKIIIDIDGTFRNTLTSDQTFNGTITVEGEDLPVAKDERQLELQFENEIEGSPMMYFTYSVDESGNVGPGIYNYGYIYINKDFSQFTIKKYGQKEEGKSWSGSDGMMITAPATNREEAIEISDQLIESYKRVGDTFERADK